MTPSRVRTIALRAAPRPDPTTRAADAELLGRFLDARDEAAFTSLVARHLPAVRAVCRSVLRDPNDADDATQATFLVLVRRAGSVRDRAAVGAWLARVAWRAALRLRATNLRRAAHSTGTDLDGIPTPAPAARPEAETALHEELARLPERYRLAVLTCYAAGTPTADAARQLGWPKGTLLTRLAWARRRLRKRLEERGLAPAGGFAVLFAPRAGRVGAALLSERIGRAGFLVSTGDPLARVLIPGRVASLTEGVVRAMIGTKLKLVAAAVLTVVALLGLGLGRMTADPPRPSAQLPAAQQPTTAPPAAEPPRGVKGEPGDLVVRRPRGSYTREVPGYGKLTFTFADGRLHADASVRIEGAAFTVSLEGDYAMNAESMVFGVITTVEVQGAFPPEDAAEVTAIAGSVSDVPFAFRVRVEDDAVAVKDIRFGALGSAAFFKAMEGLDADEEVISSVLMMLSGKYRADANPARPAPPAGPGLPAPARRTNTSRTGAVIPPPAVPAPYGPPTAGAVFGGGPVVHTN